MNFLILTFTPEELAILRDAAARAGMSLEAWADLALARASQAPAVWASMEVGGRRVEWYSDGSEVERTVNDAHQCEHRAVAPAGARLDEGPAG